MKVVIMSGLPGSGKSTYIKTHYPKFTDEVTSTGRAVKTLHRRLVVSADHFFENLGKEEGLPYKFEPSMLGQAHGLCLRKFIDLCQSGNQPEVLVVDNTNLTSEEIAPYYAVAQAYGLETELVTLHVDPEVCAKRNIHNVPLEALKGMASRLAGRKLPPFWAMRMKTWDYRGEGVSFHVQS